MRPPWALPEDDFTELCRRGNDCRSACPEGIIIQGQSGFPAIDFAAGPCTFCGACVDACPPGALLRQHPGADNERFPWHLRLKVESNCLGARGTVCRICEGKCESRAIRFAAATTWGLPRIDHDACTGCGACVAPCPVDALVLHPLEEDPRHA